MKHLDNDQVTSLGSRTGENGRAAREAARAQSLAIFIALALAVYLSWLLIRPFLWAVTWAVVMTVLFYPVHEQLRKWIVSPVWSATLSTLLVVVTILAPTTLVARTVADEAQVVAQEAPRAVARLLNPSNPLTGSMVRRIERYQTLDGFRDPHWIETAAKEWSGNVRQSPMHLVGGVVAVAIQLALTVFTMFYLFKDARLMRTRLYELVPVENRRLREFFVRTRDVIFACAYGTLLVAVVQGALGGLAFWALGLPSPVLWGMVMVLLSVIPTLGAFVVWIPAAVYLATTGHPGQAVALTLWGTIVVGLADNLLRPILIGNRARMHELLVFFGVLGGLELFGVVGIFIGPVIFAITFSLVDALREVGAPAAVGGRAA